jgi:23S rRNA pseudouridine2605 synthase
MLVRLQKFLSEAGVASRRASEEIITAGRVAVNRRVVVELGSKVDPEKDSVTVDGTPVKPKRKLYIALNKPRGYLSSRTDPQDRRTVHSLLPKEWANLFTVGRLDMDSEGLIFLTNDGEFSLHLTHPRYGIRKKYLVMVEGRVDPAILPKLTRGVVHGGERLKAEKARILKTSNAQTILELELAEGKYREVRRLFESQAVTVAALKRVQIGPIKLGELPSGKWRTLSQTEVVALLKPTQASHPRAPK